MTQITKKYWMKLLQITAQKKIHECHSNATHDQSKSYKN